MIVLIDAYNLLKQLLGNGLIKASAQRKFIDQLDQYARKKHHEIIVVFDGYAPDELEAIQRPWVKSIYAGRMTADDLIKRLIPRYRAHDLLLVSSDGDVCVYAQRYGVASMDSLLFYDTLSQALKNEVTSDVVRMTRSKFPAQRSNATSFSEIDTLMHQASVLIVHKDVSGNDTPERARSGKTRSKKDKKMLKIVKKL